MSVFKNLFAKVAGTAAGSFFAANRLIIVAVLIAIVAGGMSYYVWGAERAKGKVETLKNELDDAKADFGALELTIQLNKEALKTCLIVNKQNDIDLRNQERRVQETEKIVMLLQAESKHTVEDIRNDGEKLRGKDTVCRTVDESLPDWFTVGLWE